MTEGNFIYQGYAKNLVDYFGKIGYNCPDFTNPPDNYIRIIHVVNRKSLTPEECAKLDVFIENYKKNEKTALSEIKTLNLSVINNEFKSYHAGFFTELGVLTRRAYINSTRNLLLFYMKIFAAIAMGFLIDIIFHDLNRDTIRITNREGVIFFSITCAAFLSSNANSMTFPAEFPLFVKEYKEGRYGVCAYGLSKLIAEIPVQLLFVVIYVVMFYFAVDLNMTSASKFFVYFGITFLVHFNGCAVGNFAGSFAHDHIVATIYTTTIIAPMMMFGGFFSNTSSLAGGFYWIKYVSSFNWGFQALAINEFTDFEAVDGSDPLAILGIGGEIWEKAGALLLIEVGAATLMLCALKFHGEYAKRK